MVSGKGQPSFSPMLSQVFWPEEGEGVGKTGRVNGHVRDLFSRLAASMQSLVRGEGGSRLFQCLRCIVAMVAQVTRFRLLLDSLGK